MSRTVIFSYGGKKYTCDQLVDILDIERAKNADKIPPDHHIRKENVSYNYGSSSKYVTTKTSLGDTLKEYGIAIIPNVIDEKECVDMLSGMWDYIEHITKTWTSPHKPINRNDKSTWREFYKLLPLHSMLMQHFGVGHAQVSWNLRENPTIVDIFAEFWGVKPEELLVSFDGMSFGLPPEDTNKGYFRPKKSEELSGTLLENTGKAWLHRPVLHKQSIYVYTIMDHMFRCSRE